MRLLTSNDQLTKKLQIVAQYVGITLETSKIELGKDNVTEEFLLKNPIGKVPVLETPEGFIFESNAIAKYLAHQNPSLNLLGRTVLEGAQVDQWLFFCSNEIEPSAWAWLGPISGMIPFNPELHQQAVNYIKTAMHALQRYLERHTYLVGERLSLADIVVAAALSPLYQKVFDPMFRKPFFNVNRWFELITQQSNFKAVFNLAPAMWCTVAQKGKGVDQKKKDEAPKKEEKKKEEHPKKEDKKEEKKKEEAPKEDKKKKPKDDDEEEEDDIEKEEKKPNPLDNLPKSTFQLDAYKREYSNNKNIDASTQFLWDNFDPEGFCLFFCRYKYNDENNALFKTTNLIGGFYQRLERMHKYAFGTMLIHGTDKSHEVSGFWIFRGPILPEAMLDVPDTELYDWVPIPWASIDEHKPRILSYLKWEALDGKECADGKTFK